MVALAGNDEGFRLVCHVVARMSFCKLPELLFNVMPRCQCPVLHVIDRPEGAQDNVVENRLFRLDVLIQAGRTYAQLASYISHRRGPIPALREQRKGSRGDGLKPRRADTSSNGH